MKKQRRTELERIIREKREQAISFMTSGNISAYIKTLIDIESHSEGVETMLAS